jgi:rhodanese-related sulfurtransferase
MSRGPFVSGSEPGVANLTAVALKTRLDRGESMTVLDVREDDEHSFCAIPVPSTAREIHIPMNLVSSRLDELRASTGQEPLVVYCHHGVRSLSVARWLVRQGIAGVHNLAGGIDAWSQDVDPGTLRY